MGYHDRLTFKSECLAVPSRDDKSRGRTMNKQANSNTPDRIENLFGIPSVKEDTSEWQYVHIPSEFEVTKSTSKQGCQQRSKS